MNELAKKELMEKYNFRTTNSCDNCEHSGWLDDNFEKFGCKILEIGTDETAICDLYIKD